VTSGSSTRPTDNTLYAFKMPGTSNMQRLRPTRVIMPGAVMLLALFAASSLLQAQFMGRKRGSDLPATPPTPPAAAPAPAAAPTPAPQATQPPPAPAAPTTPANRANVTYANGLLTVSATNSSLNQILREISRQTGMKITGASRMSASSATTALGLRVRSSPHCSTAPAATCCWSRATA